MIGNGAAIEISVSRDIPSALGAAGFWEEGGMKTLVVGGTGMIGGYIALRQREEGHQVTISARKPPRAAVLADFPVLLGDYVEDSFTTQDLTPFDAIVFAACNDPRHVPPGLDKAAEDDFYRRANSLAVPRFFALARQAGVRRMAYIGSFYPQAKPDLVGPSGYIRSRLEADEGARALAGPNFHVVSLNAPVVVGCIPGIVPNKARAEWALGRREAPLHAASGGVNCISMRSLYQAIRGGLERGENGRGYLVGGENLRFADFFQLHFRAAGREVEFEIRDDEPMPFFADGALMAGRDGTIFYEPEGVAELGYEPNDMARAVREIIDMVR
jgi:nucleoside-diphosphate-sugar epimerase